MFRPNALRHAFAAALLAVAACSAPPPPATKAELPSDTQQDRAPAPTEPAQQAAPPEPAAEARPEPPAVERPAPSEALLDPSKVTWTAPDRYTVALETTKGALHVDVRRSWAPLGADRFYGLVRAGFFDDTAFFRVVSGFVAQIGLHGDPAVNAAWRRASIADDPVSQSNVAGMVTFAAAGPASRTTQFFINLGDNTQLDSMGFAPFGRVRELDLARSLFAEYGEGAPGGRGPMQARIQREGNAYLRAEFPKLDYIKSATVVDEVRSPLKQPSLPPRVAP